ncbi:MAG: DUF4097 family beta strand repeat-containing protein [Pyrinomonadaceae bacterium]
MNNISKNLKCIATASIAAVIGIAVINIFGQESIGKDKTKAEYNAKEKGFCTNNNWSSDDNFSFSELREMTIPATGTINVDGSQNGGIGVKGEDRSDVLIRACVQAWSKSDADAKAVAANIKINTSGQVKAENPSGDKNWSVSYQILVPRSTNLNLTAHNGGISISGTDGSAEFQTQNGGLNISNLSGNVKGRTTNGGVHVSLAGTSWKGTGLDIQTTNGGVNLSMPQNYSAHVETGTVNGGFNSDISSLSIEKTDENGRRRSAKISTDINGGGAPIRVTTTNGGVRITSRDDKE